MMSAILTVCRKEIFDNSRDRRTLLTSTLLGPLMGAAAPGRHVQRLDLPGHIVGGPTD